MDEPKLLTLSAGHRDHLADTLRAKADALQGAHNIYHGHLKAIGAEFADSIIIRTMSDVHKCLIDIVQTLENLPDA